MLKYSISPNVLGLQIALTQNTALNSYAHLAKTLQKSGTNSSFEIPCAICKYLELIF